MNEDVSDKFLKELQDNVISLEFEPNSGDNNMYTVNENNKYERISRGGVILGKNGQVGSRYFRYEDIMDAVKDFSEKVQSKDDTTEEKSHEVTETKKTELDMEAFTSTIKSALKVYIEENEKVTNQDARKISMDIEDEKGNVSKVTKGGIFAGKEGSEMENGEYISEEDIKLAINDMITDAPVESGTEQKENKNHTVTANKGKSKKDWWKKAVVALAILGVSLTGAHTAEGKDNVETIKNIGTDTAITYVRQLESVETDRHIVLDVGSDYKDGIGKTFEVKEEVKYGETTREEPDVEADNKYVRPGDRCQIDGISINDIKTDEIVSSTYGEDAETMDIHEFIENNAPTTGGTYKVYVHVKRLKDSGKTTRLGWVKAGMARDTGVIEKTNEDYVIVQVENGEVSDISESKYLPEGVDYSNIEKAPEEVKTETQEYIDENVVKDNVEER